MEKKHQVHNLIILDESGSMQSIKDSVISGFNEIVQTMKGVEARFPEQEHFITLLSFNGLGNKLLHFAEPVSRLQQIDAASYQPDASTPLFDAMGIGINKLKKHLAGAGHCNVLVTVFTDGEENASEEYTAPAIQALVTELKQHHWTFTYIGTDHDIEEMAAHLSITNVINFQKSEQGLKDIFATEARARYRYSAKMKMNEDVQEEFYKEDKDEGVVPGDK